MTSTAPSGPALVRTTTAPTCLASGPSAPARAWTMLTSGHYEVVAARDDGARRSLSFAAAGTRPPLLSVRETQVAAYVAVGYPLKMAAFSLGISIATAGRACATALEKLGIPNRTVLASHWGSILAPPGEISTEAA